MRKLIDEFRQFALRGNLAELVIGFTVGAAFSGVAESLVADVLMPPVGLLLGRSDFSDLFVLLRDGPGGGAPYASLAQAEAAGAVTLNYGRFLNQTLTLLIVALAMFAVIRGVNRLGNALEDEFGGDDEDAPETKKCAYCREAVPYKASRCPRCTSFLGTDGGPLLPDGALDPQAGSPGGAPAAAG